MSLLNKDIEITFLSPTGELDSSNRSEKAVFAIKNSATAQELLTEGFKLVNYNGYYGYFMPAERTFFPQAFEYTINDIQNTWQLGQFNLDSKDTVNYEKNILGVALSIWGEESEGYSSEEITQKVRPLLTSFLEAVTYGENFEIK